VLYLEHVTRLGDVRSRALAKHQVTREGKVKAEHDSLDTIA